MNVPNNKRKRESQKKIEKVFIELLQTRDVKDITVSEIVKLTKINRSTFYANYIDIYDLVDKVKDKMINDFFDIYKEEVQTEKHSYNFLKLFKHIKENQIFYKTYFKLNFDFNWSTNYLDEGMIKWFGSIDKKEYHIAFFKAGLNAIIQMWLNNNCKETPEELDYIIKKEYKKKIESIL